MFLDVFKYKYKYIFVPNPDSHPRDLSMMEFSVSLYYFQVNHLHYAPRNYAVILKIFIFRVITSGTPICFTISSECIFVIAACFLIWISRITCFPRTLVETLPHVISSTWITASRTIIPTFITTIVTPW